jgi:hypothetical protein
MIIDIIKVSLFAVYLFTDIKLITFIIGQLFRIGIKMVL